ncbi:MAG: hypothetical protein K6E57_02720 [Fibrobacter sp.]|jgi:hypothetical protein|uniref:hypothetical protein n=1 Tax=Fibrobacter sp. UWP2 TaxID=1896216 RepID=UPI000912B681|nr:hypothetical protein [Fibrobacter sp. UWP2]MBO7383914.1 hypothetical protein [Fibrobacter sp.]MCR5377861.1 hypothetical protein [Fibrobacter sp.]SHJ09306.1 hypothetical protein SAMN05720471_11658 [Fibrobacter sp. UWP2]
MNFIKICATSAALTFLCSCESNDVSLAFNTQNAPVQKFTLEANLNVFAPQDTMNTTPESMETSLKARSTLTQTVSFDNGSARFEMKIDTVDYKSDKRSVEDFRYIEKYLATQHFQFKMTGDGSISDPSVEDVALQPGTEELNLMKLFMKVQPVLPGTPVKLGDVWERPVEIPANGRTTTVYKSFKLEDLYLHDGVQMAKIGMNVKYKEVPDSTSDVRMESDGFIVGSGSILFDITHGVVTTGSLELSGHLNIHDIVASQVLPNMHVIQKIKLRGEIEQAQ